MFCPECEEKMEIIGFGTEPILGHFDRCYCKKCDHHWQVYDMPSESQVVTLALVTDALSVTEDELFWLSRKE